MEGVKAVDHLVDYNSGYDNADANSDCADSGNANPLDTEPDDDVRDKRANSPPNDDEARQHYKSEGQLHTPVFRGVRDFFTHRCYLMNRLCCAVVSDEKSPSWLLWRWWHISMKRCAGLYWNYFQPSTRKSATS